MAATAARWLRTGALAGAVLGALFALAVVSFADCAGPDCTRERLVGIAGHAAAGALLGAALAAAALLGRWAARALRRRAS